MKLEVEQQVGPLITSTPKTGLLSGTAIAIGPTEPEAFWMAFLRSLVTRRAFQGTISDL